MPTGKPILLGVSGRPEVSDHGVAVTMPFTAPNLLDSRVVGILIDNFTGSADWSRKECTRVLSRGGRLVVLCGPNVGRGLQSEFGQWLRRVSGIAIQAAGGALTIMGLTPQLQRLLGDDLAYYYFGESGGIRPLAVNAEEKSMLVGAITDVGAGQIAVLPIGISITHNTIEHLAAIVDAIPPTEGYPDNLDALEVPGEARMRVDLSEMREQIEHLEAALEGMRRLKRILYVGKLDLEIAVVEFLTTELGIPARHVPGLGGDFWLTEDDHDWAIGEVKSYETGNVDKGAVSQLWTHRREAGHGEDFPALLIANTYYKRTSVKEREEAIHPDVVRRAYEDNVLVARTLDLFRMRQSPQARDALVGTLKQRGGWFQVDADLVGKVSPA